MTKRDEPVATTAGGVECGDTSLAWSEVREVLAYKKDLLTTDLVCLEFITFRDTAVVIDEERPGFHELLRKLPNFLDGFPPAEDWWRQVEQPPFATNLAHLWMRGMPSK